MRHPQFNKASFAFKLFVNFIRTTLLPSRQLYLILSKGNGRGFLGVIAVGALMICVLALGNAVSAANLSGQTRYIARARHSCCLGRWLYVCLLSDSRAAI